MKNNWLDHLLLGVVWIMMGVVMLVVMLLGYMLYASVYHYYTTEVQSKPSVECITTEESP